MILDRIAAFEQYSSCKRGFAVLAQWLQTHRLEDLAVGTTPIDGDRVFANVMDVQTRAAESASFEVHKRYIDVQMDISGSETFQVLCGSYEMHDYDEDTDSAVAVGSSEVLLHERLGEDRFVVFMPFEPHLPTVYDGGVATPVKKVCFKILDDPYWKN